MWTRIKYIFSDRGLLAKCLRACTWVTASSLCMQIIRMLRLGILTWLLAPEMFGILALLWCVLGVLREMSDTGIGHALIQNPQGLKKDYLDTAWTLLLARNCILILILWLGAPFLTLIGGAYRNPELVVLLRMSCIILLLEGLSSIGLVALRKKLLFRPLGIIQITAQIVGLIVTIILGILWRNPRAIVVGEIAVAFVTLCLSYLAFPLRPSLCWHHIAGKELLRYGLLAYIIALVNTLCWRVNVLILGKISNEHELGLYTIALTLITALVMLLSQLSITVGFPALTQVQHDTHRFRRTTLEMIKLSQIIALPAFFFLAVFAYEIVLILPDKYARVGSLLQVLCVFGFCQVLLQQISPAFYAAGKLHWWLFRGILQMMIIMVLVVPMYNRFGIIGACWSIGIAGIVTNLVIWCIFLSVFGWTRQEWSQQMQIIWRAVLYAAAAYGVAYGVVQAGRLILHSPVWIDRIPYVIAIGLYLYLCLKHYYGRFLNYTTTA